MSKLTKETFELLQDGLDALLENSTSDIRNDTEELLKKVRKAEKELIAINNHE